MKATTNSRTDIVKKMREIRDALSLEIMDMSFDQEREFVKNQLFELKFKKQDSNIQGKRLGIKIN
jgi:hypothetical protein